METQAELKSGGAEGLERVLVASDLTAYADRALDRAAMLARSGGAICLIHAFDPRLLPDECVELNTREALESLRHEVQESGLAERFDVSVDVLSGKADEITLKQAQAIPADLIVMAMSRDASLARVIRGTTIDRVVRRALCPVLVVRSRPRRPYARILVAVDLAAASRRALDLVLQWFPDAEINIVHVDEAVRADAPSAVVRDDRRHQIEDMVAARCMWARRLGPGSAGGPSLIFRCGKIVDALQKEMGTINPDLIVAGTHGRSGASNLFLGSVAETLLETSRQDVLVARA